MRFVEVVDVEVDVEEDVVVVVGATVVDVVVTGGWLVVVAPQMPPGHASQQLAAVPMHAVPPDSATQSFAFFTTSHPLTPLASVVQHVEYPERPQVEFDSHSSTVSRHSRGRLPSRTAARATRLAHFTYFPWPALLSQLHVDWMSARVSATAWASPGSSPHAARAAELKDRQAASATRAVAR